MTSRLPCTPSTWALVVLVTLTPLTLPTAAYPSGAPFTACTGMTPGHGSESLSSTPYTISLSVDRYTEGTFITVTVSGGSFQGIMMQVHEAGTSTPVGQWTTFAPNTRSQTCRNSADTVTHENTNAKTDAQFVWEAPDTTADLEVVATIAQTKFVWWKNVKSPTLKFDVPTTTTTTTTTTMPTTTTTTTTTPTMTTGINQASMPSPTTDLYTVSPPSSSQPTSAEQGVTSPATADNVSASIRFSAYILPVVTLATIVVRLVL